MTRLHDWQRVLSGVADEFGGARRMLLSICSLCMFFVATFMPVPAVYELWMVDNVEQWQEVPVRLDAVELKRPTFGKGPSTWRYTLTDPDFGKPYEIGDVEPGDIPFSVAGWSTKDATARNYQAKVGEIIHVRRSPDGKRYFLQAGTTTTMIVLLSLCALYWLWLFSVWRKRRLSQSG